MARRDARPIAGLYLAQRVRFGMKFGLETILSLLAEMEHPERAFAVVLIAGTNGKGSVAAYCDSMLRASGLRTGRYTSPHLVRVTERITVDGRETSQRAFETAVRAVRDAAERLVRSGALEAHPTFFEALTAAALWHFRRRHVEVAILEVGLGGRLDATNATEPLASAIVSVDLDHEVYLGRALAAIAAEKAGVLRPGRPTVIGPLAAEARRAVLQRAKVVGARVVEARRGAVFSPSKAHAVGRRRDEEGGPFEPERVDLRTPSAGYEGLRPLPGAHQRDNLLVAVRLVEELGRAGLAVDLRAVPRAVARTCWPGRLQWVPGRPPLLLDGAHNPAGARALAATLTDARPYVLLFAAMADKDVEAIARELFPGAVAVVLTRPRVSRAATPGELAARTASTASGIHEEPRVSRALLLARRLARQTGPRTIVVVAGSLYLVGAVEAILERRRRTRRETAGLSGEARTARAARESARWPRANPTRPGRRRARGRPPRGRG
jgi:dihydrofolate synthase/folylpolyglutamate synthase